ncbi:DUF1659 domain-containing protein [Ornithinibacillus halophilus]|uniref:DUF1659 domain-containing protein n=1 Tax=Ornithinibacillus halophilus TaxID=930117 RepID=A0A1M5E8L9_9BACI|nr:DUF1659 domain-containing protein [Ornithinibacillus halophilus]SHF75432.1 Protein of unknown function [Ornithinibacillus halophilus]
MAVADLKNSTLRLVFNVGNDINTGEPIYKTKSFSKVKTDATADQLYAVATAFASLTDIPLYNIERRDNLDIREA